MKVINKVRDSLSRSVGAMSNVEDLKKCLANTIKDNVIHSFLSEIIVSKKCLTTIANRSYVHNNGFEKLVLLDEPNYKLRVHIWSKDLPIFQENIHDHRWNFASQILLGSYQNEIYIESEQGEDFEEFHYYPRSGRQSYPLLYIKNSKLSISKSETMREGNYLLCPVKTLHRITPTQGLTSISIFLQSQAVCSFARVLNYKGKIDEHTDIPAQSMKIEEVESTIKRILTA